jgi:tetratricopeptide (TPR) repeat protein
MRNWRRVGRLTCSLALVIALALPAGAWGPQSQLAIVTTAMSILSKSSNIPLNKLSAEIRDGVNISMAELQDLHRTYSVDPIGAVEAEMYLLQSMRGERIDPYFAYRLGILGKLVAVVTSPMEGVPEHFQRQYNTDVDQAITQVDLQPNTRDQVVPKTYFTQLLMLAAARNEAIQQDYETGLGFKGVAQKSMAADVTRSVDAVADVWYTILGGDGVLASVSERTRRSYVLDAFRFYVERGNRPEIAAASQRMEEQIGMDADLLVEIGDLFMAKAMNDEAIKYYQQALERQPNRREVIEKVAAYYVAMGENALEDEQLEVAAEAFANALKADSLHPTAERQRLEVERLINDRDARMGTMQAAIEAASELQSLAEEEALEQRYAEAVALLQEAQHKYETVNDEFGSEYQRAQTGMRNVRFRIQELRDQIVLNAQIYSGSSLPDDIRALAAAQAGVLDREALQRLVERDWDAAMKSLETDLAGSVGG